MADDKHGLKDLFGSVPPPAARPDTPARERSTSPAAAPAGSATSAPLTPLTPQAPDPRSAAQSPAATPGRTEPVAASTGTAAPVLNAPNLSGLPPGIVPEAPSAPAAPLAPATGALGLTCVVVSRGGAKAWARTMQALRLQTVADRLDVVFVSSERVPVSGEGFAQLRTVAASAGAGYGDMAAHGAQMATGELVAIIDDYAFPARDWAETILSHRHDNFAALGSALGNANPRSAHSWSNMLLEYGPWRDGLAGGTVDRLPSRNLVYRRDALVALGSMLPRLLETGEAAEQIAQNGAPLKLQDEARLLVLNPSTRASTLKARYAAGRLDAAGWAKGLSLPKRLAKSLKAALGGPARYRRERARIFQGSDPTVNPKLQGRAVMMAMVAEGLGRAAGFLRGPGKAARTRDRFTARRATYLNKVDRKQFTR